MRSSVLTLVFACAAGLVLPLAASAQSKIGVINLQKALLETSELKEASVALETKFKPRQEALEKIQRELNDIQLQLQNGQGKLTAAQAADLESQGQRKQREAQRMTEDLQAEVEAQRTNVLQQAGNRMQEVVKQIATAKDLDLVVEVSSSVYYKDAVEITTEATAAYDKAYPVNAAPAK